MNKMIWMGGQPAPPHPQKERHIKEGSSQPPPQKERPGESSAPQEERSECSQDTPRKKRHKELNKEIKKERKKQRKGAVSYPEIKAERKQ